MARDLKGIIPALLTPFDDQQRLDIESLCRLVRLNTGRGADGLYVSGSTGEAFVQNRVEREQVLGIITEEVGGKVTLITHVGAVNIGENQQLASMVHRYGFDTTLAVTPFYYLFSFEKHCDHYRAITGSANGLPMVVYSTSALSGVELTLDQASTLVVLPGVGALKQTSGGLYQMEQIHYVHPDLVLYNGYDEIFASGLFTGVDGGTGSTYNIMRWRYRGIMKVLKEGDIRTVQELQTECNRVIDLPIKTSIFRSLKTVLRCMDVTSAPLCRKPFAPVDEHYLPELKALANQLLAEKM